MTFFLLLVNFIAALVAVQFLRGDVSNSQLMDFRNVYNSFLGVYQLCSSENWTTVLYSAATSEVPFGQVVLTVVYLSFWLLFSYCAFSVPCIGYMTDWCNSYHSADVYCRY